MKSDCLLKWNLLFLDTQTCTLVAYVQLITRAGFSLLKCHHHFAMSASWQSVRPQLLNQHTDWDNLLSTCCWSWDWAALISPLPPFLPSSPGVFGLTWALQSSNPSPPVKEGCTARPPSWAHISLIHWSWLPWECSAHMASSRSCLLIPSESTHFHEGQTPQKRRTHQTQACPELSTGDALPCVTMQWILRSCDIAVVPCVHTDGPHRKGKAKQILQSKQP